MNRDYNLMRMKGSGDDCNCETQTRGDGSDIGVRSNEMRSRIQGIADSHDSSPTLRLSEESKNKAESTDHFLSQTNSSIDSTSQEVTIKQATLSAKKDTILFARSSVHSTTKSSFTSTMSKRLTYPFHTSFGP